VHYTTKYIQNDILPGEECAGNTYSNKVIAAEYKSLIFSYNAF
jgi:hypothetical protein